jgi:hypothetical protein
MIPRKSYNLKNRKNPYIKKKLKKKIDILRYNKMSQTKSKKADLEKELIEVKKINEELLRKNEELLRKNEKNEEEILDLKKTAKEQNTEILSVVKKIQNEKQPKENEELLNEKNKEIEELKNELMKKISEENEEITILKKKLFKISIILNEETQELKEDLKIVIPKQEIIKGESIDFIENIKEYNKNELKSDNPTQPENNKNELKTNNAIPKKMTSIINNMGIVIVIFKNPMLNYINKDSYKICCFNNYENAQKKHETYFIEKCELIDYLVVPFMVDPEEEKKLDYSMIDAEKELKEINIKDKVQIAKKIIMMVFKNELLINFTHRYYATVIISKNELQNKINELRNNLKNYKESLKLYDESYEVITLKNIKYEKNVIKTELFNKLSDTIKEKIIEDLKTKNPLKNRYRIMAYKTEIFKYYGNDVWCIDIATETHKNNPPSAYILISENIEELSLQNYLNFHANTEYFKLQPLLIFLLYQLKDNLLFNTENNIFVKITEEKLINIINLLNNNIVITKLNKFTTVSSFNPDIKIE